MKNLKWQCLKCKNDVIVELSSGCEVATMIVGLTTSGRKLQFGPHVSVAVGPTTGYQCSRCGEPVKQNGRLIKSRENLTAYLNKFAK